MAVGKVIKAEYSTPLMIARVELVIEFNDLTDEEALELMDYANRKVSVIPVFWEAGEGEEPTQEGHS